VKVDTSSNADSSADVVTETVSTAEDVTRENVKGKKTRISFQAPAIRKTTTTIETVKSDVGTTSNADTATNVDTTSSVDTASNVAITSNAATFTGKRTRFGVQAPAIRKTTTTTVTTHSDADTTKFVDFSSHSDSSSDVASQTVTTDEEDTKEEVEHFRRIKPVRGRISNTRTRTRTQSLPASHVESVESVGLRKLITSAQTKSSDIATSSNVNTESNVDTSSTIALTSGEGSTTEKKIRFSVNAPGLRKSTTTTTTTTTTSTDGSSTSDAKITSDEETTSNAQVTSNAVITSNEGSTTEKKIRFGVNAPGLRKTSTTVLTSTSDASSESNAQTSSAVTSNVETTSNIDTASNIAITSNTGSFTGKRTRIGVQAPAIRKTSTTIETIKSDVDTTSNTEQVSNIDAILKVAKASNFAISSVEKSGKQGRTRITIQAPTIQKTTTTVETTSSDVGATSHTDTKHAGFHRVKPIRGRVSITRPSPSTLPASETSVETTQTTTTTSSDATSSISGAQITTDENSTSNLAISTDAGSIQTENTRISIESPVITKTITTVVTTETEHDSGSDEATTAEKVTTDIDSANQEVRKTATKTVKTTTSGAQSRLRSRNQNRVAGRRRPATNPAPRTGEEEEEITKTVTKTGTKRRRPANNSASRQQLRTRNDSRTASRNSTQTFSVTRTGNSSRNTVRQRTEIGSSRNTVRQGTKIGSSRTKSRISTKDITTEAPVTTESSVTETEETSTDVPAVGTSEAETSSKVEDLLAVVKESNFTVKSVKETNEEGGTHITIQAPAITKTTTTVETIKSGVDGTVKVDTSSNADSSADVVTETVSTAEDVTRENVKGKKTRISFQAPAIRKTTTTIETVKSDVGTTSNADTATNVDTTSSVDTASNVAITSNAATFTGKRTRFGVQAPAIRKTTTTTVTTHSDADTTKFVDFSSHSDSSSDVASQTVTTDEEDTKEEVEHFRRIKPVRGRISNTRTRTRTQSLPASHVESVESVGLRKLITSAQTKSSDIATSSNVNTESNVDTSSTIALTSGEGSTTEKKIRFSVNAPGLRKSTTTTTTTTTTSTDGSSTSDAKITSDEETTSNAQVTSNAVITSNEGSTTEKKIRFGVNAPGLRKTSTTVLTSTSDASSESNAQTSSAVTSNVETTSNIDTASNIAITSNTGSFTGKRTRIGVQAPAIRKTTTTIETVKSDVDTTSNTEQVSNVDTILKIAKASNFAISSVDKSGKRGRTQITIQAPVIRKTVLTTKSNVDTTVDTETNDSPITATNNRFSLISRRPGPLGRVNNVVVSKTTTSTDEQLVTDEAESVPRRLGLGRRIGGLGRVNTVIGAKTSTTSTKELVKDEQSSSDITTSRRVGILGRRRPSGPGRVSNVVVSKTVTSTAEEVVAGEEESSTDIPEEATTAESPVEVTTAQRRFNILGRREGVGRVNNVLVSKTATTTTTNTKPATVVRFTTTTASDEPESAEISTGRRRFGILGRRREGAGRTKTTTTTSELVATKDEEETSTDVTEETATELPVEVTTAQRRFGILGGRIAGSRGKNVVSKTTTTTVTENGQTSSDSQDVTKTKQRFGVLGRRRGGAKTKTVTSTAEDQESSKVTEEVVASESPVKVSETKQRFGVLGRRGGEARVGKVIVTKTVTTETEKLAAENEESSTDIPVEIATEEPVKPIETPRRLGVNSRRQRVGAKSEVNNVIVTKTVTTETTGTEQLVQKLEESSTAIPITTTKASTLISRLLKASKAVLDIPVETIATTTNAPTVPEPTAFAFDATTVSPNESKGAAASSTTNTTTTVESTDGIDTRKTVTFNLGSLVPIISSTVTTSSQTTTSVGTNQNNLAASTTEAPEATTQSTFSERFKLRRVSASPEVTFQPIEETPSTTPAQNEEVEQVTDVGVLEGDSNNAAVTLELESPALSIPSIEVTTDTIDSDTPSIEFGLKV